MHSDERTYFFMAGEMNSLSRGIRSYLGLTPRKLLIDGEFCHSFTTAPTLKGLSSSDKYTIVLTSSSRLQEDLELMLEYCKGLEKALSNRLGGKTESSESQQTLRLE